MDISPILKTKYPEGSYGGQCGVWAHNVLEFGPIGNSYREKKKFIELHGIIKPNIAEIGKGYRTGDLVVTDEGTFMGLGYGHVAVILDPKALTVVESNFNKDGRVRYGRKLDPKRIYGIGRFPFKFKVPPVKLRVSAFMNNFKKQWNSKIFGEIEKWFADKIEIFPLNTKFQNWSYKVYAQSANVITKEYFDEVVMPLKFPESHIVALNVCKREWEGSVWDSNAEEIAYYHFGTNPAQIQIASDENDLSPWYYGEKLFSHALKHEIMHFIYYLNGLDDRTHSYDNYARRLDLALNDPTIDWNRVYANLA